MSRTGPMALQARQLFRGWWHARRIPLLSSQPCCPALVQCLKTRRQQARTTPPLPARRATPSFATLPNSSSIFLPMASPHGGPHSLEGHVADDVRPVGEERGLAQLSEDHRVSRLRILVFPRADCLKRLPHPLHDGRVGHGREVPLHLRREELHELRHEVLLPQSGHRLLEVREQREGPVDGVALQLRLAVAHEADDAPEMGDVGAVARLAPQRRPAGEVRHVGEELVEVLDGVDLLLHDALVGGLRGPLAALARPARGRLEQRLRQPLLRRHDDSSVHMCARGAVEGARWAQSARCAELRWPGPERPDP
mmetsp:Transcript_71373/g.220382  ORF Transcript_71373/g.220382 Transcript_71373/m.220382 type:complete len:310 (+) Transcript_71373:319-1248(+)